MTYIYLRENKDFLKVNEEEVLLIKFEDEVTNPKLELEREWWSAGGDKMDSKREK